MMQPDSHNEYGVYVVRLDNNDANPRQACVFWYHVSNRFTLRTNGGINLLLLDLNLYFGSMDFIKTRVCDGLTTY